MTAKAWVKFWDSIVGGYYIDILNGLKITVIIAISGLIIGIFVGTLIAISKVVPSKNPLVKIWRGINTFYVSLFRGTPMVVQLLIFYFVLFPAIHLGGTSNLIIAILVYGLNSGAYVSEIMRGGILSVDDGQMEAGRSLGLSYSRSMTSIVIPQAVKNILPTLGNEFITLIKETSVVSFIAVIDLTRAFQLLGGKNYEYMVPYIVLAIMYYVIVMLISYLVKLLERRLARSDKKR